MSGKGVYAAYDLPLGVPGAPFLQATRTGNTVHLAWSKPDDHGSLLTGYHLYKGPDGGHLEQFLGVGPDVNAYDDNTTGNFAYGVKAVNGQGESAACGAAEPAVAVSPTVACTAPGIQVASDPSGDAQVASLDVQSLSISEPAGGGPHKITFTLKVGSLASITPGSAWMILWNRPQPDATYDRNYVVMRASGLGTVSYKYGKISPPNVNQATDLGDATGSFSADGTIRITVTTDKVDNVAAGQDLAAVEVRTFAVHLSGQPSSQATSIDHTNPATYTLVANGVCQ